jgi:hypothetical protein
MFEGVKVAVAPDGNPAAARVMAAGKVDTPTGVTARVYVAAPPGWTVVVLDDPAATAMLKKAPRV